MVLAWRIGTLWWYNLVISAVVADSSITGSLESTASRAKNDAVLAIIPTESGQIGINPVETNLGSAKYYQLTKHTLPPIPSTSSALIAVETATGDSSDQRKGDVGYIFPPKIADALRTTADGAIQACQLRKRGLSKRLDSLQCMIDAAVKASGEDGPFEAAMTPEFWEQLSVGVAENAPEALTNALAVLSSQAQKNKALLVVGAIMAGTKASGAIDSINIPAAGVGNGEKDDQPKCDPKAPLSKDSPPCSSEDCQGEKDQKCTVDPHKGCACMSFGELVQPMQPNDIDWWNQQQKLLAQVIDNPNLLAPSAPLCSTKDGGTAFDGRPYVEPATWCVCGQNGKSSIVPTITGNTESPCAYTTWPSATISPKDVSGVSQGGSITTCRTSTTSASSLNFQTYCTCNDNNMYTLTTWTEGGTAKSECEATHKSTTVPPPTTSAPPPPPPTSSEPPKPSCPAEGVCCKACPGGKTGRCDRDTLALAGDCFCADPCKDVKCAYDAFGDCGMPP